MKMKRSRSRWMIAAGLLAGMAVAFTLLLSRANAKAQAEFDARIAALEAAGEPVSIKDLARKPPLPHDNAATFLRRASGSIESIDKEATAAYENLSPEDQTAVDLWRPPASYVNALREALDAYPQALDLVDQAVNAPSYDAQLDYTADPATFWDELEKQTLQINRRSVRLLDYRATLQLADGDAEGALRTALKMLKVCSHFDNDPTLLGALVAIACRGIALFDADQALRSGPISEPLRKQLDDELAKINLPEVYRRGLVGDRAFGLDTLRAVESGKLRATQDDKRWLLQIAATFAKQRSDYLDYMAKSIALADRPYADVIDNPKLTELSAGVDPAAEVVMPSIKAAHAALCRNIAYIRGVLILNSIQRYERDHSGQQPTLAELGLPREVTTDPFNGQTLHVVKLPEGWSIYTVDMNLKDDGGRDFPADSGLLTNRISAKADARQ